MDSGFLHVVADVLDGAVSHIANSGVTVDDAIRRAVFEVFGLDYPGPERESFAPYGVEREHVLKTALEEYRGFLVHCIGRREQPTDLEARAALMGAACTLRLWVDKIGETPDKMRSFDPERDDLAGAGWVVSDDYFA